jgi:hypothetical protein
MAGWIVDCAMFSMTALDVPPPSPFVAGFVTVILADPGVRISAAATAIWSAVALT